MPVLPWDSGPLNMHCAKPSVRPLTRGCFKRKTADRAMAQWQPLGLQGTVKLSTSESQLKLGLAQQALQELGGSARAQASKGQMCSAAPGAPDPR